MNALEPLPAGWQLIRKLPVTVAVIRWTESNLEEVQALTGASNFHPVSPEDRTEDPERTAEVWDKLHGTWVGVRTGQWVVRGVAAEFYPLDDCVRTETYEPVTDTPAAVVVATLMPRDRLLLSWYRSAGIAKAGGSSALLRVSRSGVLVNGNSYLHSIPEPWITDAKRAFEALTVGRRDEAQAFVTHRRGGEDEPHIVEVTR